MMKGKGPTCRLPKQGYTKGLHSSMLLKAQKAFVQDCVPPPFIPNVCCSAPPLTPTRQTQTPTGTQYLLSKYAKSVQRVFNNDYNYTCGGISNTTQAFSPSAVAPVSGFTQNTQNAPPNPTPTPTPTAPPITEPPLPAPTLFPSMTPTPTSDLNVVRLTAPRPDNQIQYRIVSFSTGIDVSARPARRPAGSQATARSRQVARSVVVLQPWQQPSVQFPPCPLSPLRPAGIPAPPLKPCIPGSRVVA